MSPAGDEPDSIKCNLFWMKNAVRQPACQMVRQDVCHRSHIWLCMKGYVRRGVTNEPDSRKQP
jgi:hypothetical protein